MLPFSLNDMNRMSLYVSFFADTPTTGIYTLSLHDALPISEPAAVVEVRVDDLVPGRSDMRQNLSDRKSTRLNSSHVEISYAVFCLKKKKTPKRRESREAPKTTERH